MKNEAKNRRKFERLVLAPEGRPPIDDAYVWFVLQESELKRRILNVSYRGVGVQLEAGDRSLLSDRSEIPLTLEFEGVLAKTSGTFAFLNDKMAGIQFLALDDVSRRLISAYIDPRYLGTHLHEVPISKLQEKNCRLFLGPNNTSLVLYYSDTSVSKLEEVRISFLTHTLILNKDGKLKTATSRDELNVLSELGLDPKPNEDIVHQAVRLLRYSALDDDLRLNLELKLFQK